jgi:hypothetical protein
MTFHRLTTPGAAEKSGRRDKRKRWNQARAEQYLNAIAARVEQFFVS